jgi:hypothetical protein
MLRRAGTIIEHGIGQMLVAYRVFTFVASADGEGCCEPPTGTFAAYGYSRGINRKARRLIMQPSQGRITVVERYWYWMLRRQTISDRENGYPKRRGDLRIHEIRILFTTANITTAMYVQIGSSGPALFRGIEQT